MYLSKGKTISDLMAFRFILVCLLSVNFVQAEIIASLANSPSEWINTVDTSALEKNQLLIKMPFAQQVILNPEQQRLLTKCVVLEVQLVYTKYRTSKNFNQKGLNVKRLQSLKKLVPTLFDNPLWDFKLVGQTNGNSREECDEMFHGFIITYRPDNDTSMFSQEINYLKQLTETLTDSTLDDSVFSGIKTRWDDRVGYIHDSVWVKKKPKELTPIDLFYDQSLYQDSTVLQVLNRNQKWKNKLIVTDVTGSMSPYTAQVFVWIKQQAKQQKDTYFVFFNDGNWTDSSKKKPMKTGGIYGIRDKHINKIMLRAIRAMENGSGGGESLENDVEAMVKGLNDHPSTKHIVLIADNYESMRDYAFMDQITKPVHVVLCGADHRINVQYLDLALKTGGSVHTKTTDLIKLDRMKNGKPFEVDGKTYFYKNSQFHSMY